MIQIARLLSLVIFAIALPVHAAVFTVTKTADTLDGACNSDCSLREAVSAANANPNDEDVLVVPAGIYALSRAGAGEELNATGDLDIDTDLILVGAGAGRTILDGAGLDRVLDIRGRVEVFGVTVRNGRVDGDGGGILVRLLGFLRGDLLLYRSVVSGNQALNGGDGGGIAVLSDLEVRESAILDNHAEGYGGGIATGSGGWFALRNVTVSGNAADRSGGGLSYREENEVTVSGSTVAFNRAQESGGGVYSGSLFPGVYLPQISGSIVALNTAPASPDCRSAGSAGYNVFGVGLGCNPVPTDTSGTEAAPLDANLAPLSGAFGPTPVHALLSGSPAIGAVASSFCEPADQDGQPRSAPCEAGAWEWAEHPVCIPGGSVLCLQRGRFRVTATWRTDPSLPVQNAEAVPLTDDTGNYWFFSADNLELMVKVLDGCAVNQHWWVFSSGLTDRNVNLRVEDLATGRSWTYSTQPGKTFPPRLDTSAFDCAPPIEGAAAATVAGDADPPAVLVVTKTEDTLDGACDHDCSLREAVVSANARKGPGIIFLGPGIYTLSRPGRGEDKAATGDLDVTSELLVLGAGADRSVLDGGGIDRVLELRTGMVELRDLTVRNGWAADPPESTGDGGGIRAWAVLSLVRSLVTANRAEGFGGGISGGEMTILDSTISDNSADYAGGIHSDELYLQNVTVSGNHASSEAGGIFIDFGWASLNHATITGNTASAAGGIKVYDGCNTLCPPPTIEVVRTVIAGNTAAFGPDCSGVLAVGGQNVFGVRDGCADLSALAGTIEQPLDPRLTPLAFHGGPTPTHVPLPGSPLIDRASCNVSNDQRGRSRPADGDGNGNGNGQALCDAGAVEVQPACQPDEDTLCLGVGDRFQINIRWTAQGQTGPGKAVPLALDTGAFWFFDPANLELTVKVLDGCGVNGRFWVFLTGLTDVGVELTVTDTQTGEMWTHTQTAGTPFQPRLDTNALEVCP